MKRFIHWFLIITLLLCLLPVSTNALDSEEPEPQSSTETTTTESATNEATSHTDTTSSDDKEVSRADTNKLLAPTEPALPVNNLSTVQRSSPAVSQRKGIVISQFQTRGSSGNADDELIELYNNSDQTLDVTDWCLKRASALGATYTKLVCFTASETGKESRVLLSPRSHVFAVSSASTYTGFDMKFSAGLSDAGGRIGIYNQRDEKQDLLAWGSTTVESETSPITTLPPQGSLLQRKSLDENTYQDTDSNAADFEVASPRENYSYGSLSDGVDYCLNLDGLQASVPEGWSRDASSGECINVPVNMCSGLLLSEIAANTTAQFIELYNTNETSLDVGGCKLQTNRSSAQFNLPSQIISPHGFVVIPIVGSNLTLTKTTSGTVYLLSSDGATELQSVSYQDLSENTSWAWFGGNDWRQTYAITQGVANRYQQYLSCEVGYERNEATGRCNKMESLAQLTPCKEGQYRSEETNRCRSIALAAASVLKPCADDQFRNPLTNRCKNIASSDDVSDCGEGRERNPTTNRCRNIVSSDVPAAAFAVQPVKDGATAFVGWWALGGVATLALAYAGWEWRREITSFLQKALLLIGLKI
jgi:hypothetical protein